MLHGSFSFPALLLWRVVCVWVWYQAGWRVWPCMYQILCRGSLPREKIRRGQKLVTRVLRTGISSKRWQAATENGFVEHLRVPRLLKLTKDLPTKGRDLVPSTGRGPKLCYMLAALKKERWCLRTWEFGSIQVSARIMKLRKPFAPSVSHHLPTFPRKRSITESPCSCWGAY